MDRKSLMRFNVLLALTLILFFVALALIWIFVVTPLCDPLGWKPPCPPKDF